MIKNSTNPAMEPMWLCVREREKETLLIGCQCHRHLEVGKISPLLRPLINLIIKGQIFSLLVYCIFLLLFYYASLSLSRSSSTFCLSVYSCSSPPYILLMSFLLYLSSFFIHPIRNWTMGLEDFYFSTIFIYFLFSSDSCISHSAYMCVCSYIYIVYFS